MPLGAASPIVLPLKSTRFGGGSEMSALDVLDLATGVLDSAINALDSAMDLLPCATMQSSKAPP